METLDKVYSTYRTRGLKSLKCAACNLGAYFCSNGYRCFRSGFFFHEECANSKQEVFNPYHPQHPLKIMLVSEIEDVNGECKRCREMTIFTCNVCELLDDRFPYGCHLCELSFHKDCAESPTEINYSCHPYHPLKRLSRVPSYTDGKCCLCGSQLHMVFYHCFICNFSVDLNCAKSPPPVTLFDPKAHGHQLTLLPQRTFVCNACGMSDDPNPYVCLLCNFMIHRSCINIPHIIKINHHVHRIRYYQRLNAGDWKCGVCQKEIIWTCGAYSCLKCHGLAFHVKCATRFGIWDGTEHEDINEDTTDSNSYKVIEEGVIKHFSHEKHTLKLKEASDAYGECVWCIMCAYPIFSSPFYDCMECDEFTVHQKCAYLPKIIKDSFFMLPMTLVSNFDATALYICNACNNFFRGSAYGSVDNHVCLDVRCGSISEPFVHESHPHSLYIHYSTGDRNCNACGNKGTMFLSCEECEFFLHIKCSTLPKMAKHKNDKDHLLSLCYGEKRSMNYWCDVCEEDLHPNKWFYSCDYCAITIHIKCTLGDFIWIKPGEDKRFSVISNNHINRLVCDVCKSRCKFSSILNFFEEHIICSIKCFNDYGRKRL